MPRILLVEDNEPVRRLMRRAFELEQAGMECVGEAADADEGLRLARELQPDAVVVDGSLQGRGGLTMLDELREALPHAVVVLCSGSVDPAMARKAVEAGFDGALGKEDILELPTLVLRLLGTRSS